MTKLPSYAISDDEWELDRALDVLEEADKIRSDAKLMEKIEERARQRVRDAQDVEKQLFGGSEE